MFSVITDNIDVWTSAQRKRSTVGRGGKSKFELYGIKKLRELIFELAVRGLLVPQDPNDVPASELLNKIEEEKSRLVKEGKIKKQKKLSEIEEDEKDFDLPKGWQWVRLGDIADFVNGYTFKSSDFKSEGIGIVKIGDIQNGTISVDSMSRVDERIVSDLNSSLAVNKGDMLIAMSGATTGKLGFNQTNEVFYLNQRVGKITPYQIISRFLFYPLSTKIEENLSKSMGSAIPNLSTVQIKNIVFGIPPAVEQHRIVVKVDELMVLCDQLEQEEIDNRTTHQTLVKTLLNTLTSVETAEEFTQSWQQISEHFDILFTDEESIEELKQTILQLAVMGKLVPQDSNDEPASELLKKIEKEKEQLVKEKKIKKPISLTSIFEDEKPYALPSSWEFTRFGNITNRIGSGSTPRGGKSAYQDEGIIFLRSQNVHNDGLKLEDVAYISEETHKKMNNTKVIPDDILLNITGGSLGRSTIYPKDIGEANVSQHVTIIRPTITSTNQYLHYCILSPYIQGLIWERQVGMAREGLSKKVFELFEIPFPPLNEQQRIVKKIDELMTICDKLKMDINDAKSNQVLLADAIVAIK